MQPNQDYKQLLTDVIKKQIVILGPDITLSKARNVKGLTVANDGTVTNVEGSAQEVTQALIDQFVQLSGLIVKKTMEPLLSLSQPTPQAPTQPQPKMAQPVATNEPVPQPVAAPQPIPTQPAMPTEPAASPTPAAPQQAPIPTQPPVNNLQPPQPVPAITSPAAQPTISEPAKNPLAA